MSSTPYSEITLSSDAQGVLAGGGEMGALMRAHDWSQTPVGPVEIWPQSLRTALGILLDSSYPMYIAWGPEYTQFYNDGYRPILGATKHPGALGESTRTTFTEIWPFIGPMFDRVMRAAVPTFLQDQLLPLDRYGYVEECYFTFCYSAIRGELGTVGGVFVTVVETTERVIGARRLSTLRDMAARGVEAKTVRDAVAACVGAMQNNPYDLPFSLVYLLDAAGESARLVGTSGIEPETALGPLVIALDSDGVWPLRRAMSSGGNIVVNGLGEYRLTCGPWPEHPAQAVVQPIKAAGQARPAGFLVGGVSARRALDESYHSFHALAAAQIGAAIGNASAYEEAAQRAEVLAQLDRSKTAFFSNVSHEFRTPLTLLLAPLDELRNDAAIGESAREKLDVAHRSALRLLKLVNMLLDFSRVEAGRVDASFEPVDLALCTTDLASTFRSLIERAGLTLTVSCAPLSQPIYVDRNMWEKVVLNLLSNAFKHTFRGGIAVELREVGGAAELNVRDTGVGIPADELDRVFDRFHRVPGTRSRTHEGSGIGLALVQELVRLHGGTVTVQSELDVGTSFTVRVPFGSEHLSKRARGASHEGATTDVSAAAYVEEALRWLPDQPVADGASLHHPRAEDPTPVDRNAIPAARILLADDNADMRQYLTRLLRERGWGVESVANGREALERALSDPPDLILTDVMMPELDGFALLRALRDRAETALIPVILLSARAGEETRVEGLDAGADDYLVKPFPAQELVARVGAHLALDRRRRALYEAERRAREEADAARAEAERANKAKTEFLATMSHELRTPLNAIAGYVDILQLGIRGPLTPQQLEDLRRIRRSEQHLLALINDVLNLARLEAGNLGLAIRAVPLRPILADIEALAGGQARGKDIRLHVAQCPPDLTTQADDERLRQILLNLVTNAIKFTPRGGSISVECVPRADIVEISVADTGRGIPQDKLESIFEPFVQVDRGDTLQHQGIGLGLAISRDLARMMHGDIMVESREGHGSRFTVRLPAGR